MASQSEEKKREKKADRKDRKAGAMINVRHILSTKQNPPCHNAPCLNQVRIKSTNTPNHRHFSERAPEPQLAMQYISAWAQSRQTKEQSHAYIAPHRKFVCQKLPLRAMWNKSWTLTGIRFLTTCAQKNRNRQDFGHLHKNTAASFCSILNTETRADIFTSNTPDQNGHSIRSASIFPPLQHLHTKTATPTKKALTNIPGRKDTKRSHLANPTADCQTDPCTEKNMLSWYHVISEGLNIINAITAHQNTLQQRLHTWSKVCIEVTHLHVE